MPRAFVDLHCHTSASFDSLASPDAVVRAAASRGLTHLAITDHDRIDGALEAREHGPAGLTILVGQEVRTAGGDLICVFLERAVPAGLPVIETIELVHDQGGLVGIPHPFDSRRGSLLLDQRLASIASMVDWVEAHNARVFGHKGNERAANFAREHGLPGVAVSDAHSVMEIGVAYSILDGEPDSPEGLKAALATIDLVPGRGSLVARAYMPFAKIINQLRGNGRHKPDARPEVR